MKYLIVVLFLLISCGVVSAQQIEGGAKNTRWQFSLQSGLDLGSYQREYRDKTGSSMYQAEGHFRLSRFFDLGLQLGFNRVSNSYWGEYDSDFQENPIQVQIHGRKTNRYLGFQPRFNYRVGQGDLSLSMAMGVVHHRNVLRFASPEPYTARLGFRPLIDYYFQLSLGYTYWPTQRIGFSMSLSHLSLEHGKLSGNVDNETTNPLYLIERGNLPNQGGQGNIIIDYTAFGELRERVEASKNLYLTLGVIARPFNY